MKAIIHGFRYDTEKAKLIGEYFYSNRGDFHFIREGLYVTPLAKRYFLAGEGGAMSKYSQRIGQNCRQGGEKISPMTKDEALAWAEEFLPVRDFEEHFAECIQDA